MREHFKDVIPSSFDAQLYTQVFICYQTKFDIVQRNIVFEMKMFKGFEFYKRDTKKHKKGDLKKVVIDKKQTPLSNCLTYLARYGNENTIDYINSNINKCDENKREFYNNILRCCNCNSQVYDFQTYFLITFPLEEVYDYKNKIIKMQTQKNNSNYIQNKFNSPNTNQTNASNNNYSFYQQNQFNNNAMIFNNYEINIYDCFDFNRKVNFYDGDNSLYCDYCKKNSNFYLCKNLITGPKILIISLNNAKVKSNIKFNFQDKLNLYNYIQDKNNGFLYKLIGVITHIDMGNNFIAFCMDPITSEWYKYNDIIVSEVKDFKNEIINSIIPSILFYQKVNS
jgi:hypothetical protein